MKFIIFFIFIASCMTCTGQASISGHISDSNTGAPLEGTRVTISVLDSIKVYPGLGDSLMGAFTGSGAGVLYDSLYKKVKNTFTDKNGLYQFDSIKANIYRVSAFHRTKEVKPGHYEGEYFEISGISINGNTHIEKSFSLHVTCEYDSTKNLVYCPVCKKKDKVLLIRYGLPAYPFKEEPGYCYYGYCDVPRCHPVKLCTRCRHEF